MEMNNWLIVAVVLGIVTTAAIVAAVVIKRKKGKAEIQSEEKYKAPVAEEKTAHEEKPVADENTQLIADGIRKNAGSFNGLYEGVFQIAQNSGNADSDAIDEWKIRVGNMNDNDDFKTAVLNLLDTGDLASRAVRLLECIELAGIKRADETEYAFEMNVSTKYVCLSGNNLDRGTLCTVLKPYWYMDSKVIEQGCIIRKDG